MSEVKVNKISPRSGTAITLGDSGDTFTIPSGATLAIAGSITGFTSAGIDDNATSVAITIDSSERVGIGNTSPTGALDVKSGTQPQLKVATASATADRNAGFLVTASNSATPGSRSVVLSLDADGGDGSGTDNLTITKTGGGGNATITNQNNAGLVFGTNNAEGMRLTSTGLGIGTTSPSTTLHIKSNTPILTFEETDQSNRQFQIGSFGNAYAINDATNSQFRYILDNSGNHVFNEGGADCDFRVESDANTHALFIEGSSGNIGIGTSNPQNKLHLDIGTDNTGIRVNSTDATTGIALADNGGSIVTQTTNSGNFRILVGGDANTPGDNSSEAMRILSDGKVGIGTTSPEVPLSVLGSDTQIHFNESSASSGGYLMSEAAGQFGISGGAGFKVGGSNWMAKSTEAAIIGHDSGGDIKFFSNTSLTVGNTFTPTERMRLHSNGVISSTGGIALGVGIANTASNVLDDYEEGSWSPAITTDGGGGNSGVTFGDRYGTYTKIGRVVTVHVFVNLDAVSSFGTGNVIISTLPFSSNTDSGYRSAISIGFAKNWDNAPSGGTISSNTNVIYLRKRNGTSALENFTDIVQVGDMNANSEIILTATYETA